MGSEAKNRWIFSFVYLLTVFGLFLLFQSLLLRTPSAEVSYDDLVREIRAGRIAEVEVGENRRSRADR